MTQGRDRRELPEGDRDAARAVLRWVLGGPPVDSATFSRGFEALPKELRPLAAHHALASFEELEDHTRQRLTMVERAAHVAWMARRAAIQDLRGALEPIGVDFVFLKGAALAEQVYPHPATRPMSDVDVWIPEQELERGVGALAAAGFTVPARHDDPTMPREMAPEGHVERRVAGGVILFELHTSPRSLRGLGAGEMDALRARKVSIGPAAMPALPLDAQLLHVCLHATRSHGCVAGLKSLVDIGWILRAAPDDSFWTKLTALVRDAGAAAAVHVSLDLARSEVGAQVPHEILSRLATPKSDDLVERAREIVWSPQPKLPRGTFHLAGLATEPDWLRNRLRLQREASAGDREQMTSADQPDPALVLRYFTSRATAFARVAVSGEMLRPSFWRRVGAERRSRLWIRDLRRVEGG